MTNASEAELVIAVLQQAIHVRTVEAYHAVFRLRQGCRHDNYALLDKEQGELPKLQHVRISTQLQACSGVDRVSEVESDVKFRRQCETRAFVGRRARCGGSGGTLDHDVDIVFMSICNDRRLRGGAVRDIGPASRFACLRAIVHLCGGVDEVGDKDMSL